MTASTDTAGDGTGLVLVHHASTPAFTPVSLVAPVTFLGRVAGNDVVIDSPNVSRRHAKLVVTELGVTAHDLDSHNGMFLNGKKVRSTAVSVGDLLYVGDICVSLQRGPATPFDITAHTALGDDDPSDDDPRARVLAATLRAVELCADGDDLVWAAETVQICRDLVEATVAAFVEVHADGELDAPVTLQPDGEHRASGAILWSIVRKVIASGTPIFSRDIVNDGLVESADDLRAVICVPVIVDGTTTPTAVIYLANVSAGQAFTELEAEALQGIARVVAMRLERQLRPADVVSLDHDDVDTGNSAILLAQQQQHQLVALGQQLQLETDELQQVTARMHGLESDNLKLRQQADIDRNAALKKDAERERELQTRIEQATLDGRRLGQRDAAVGGRDQLQQLQELIDAGREQQHHLQELVDAACAERDALLDQNEALRVALDVVTSERDSSRAASDGGAAELVGLRAELASAMQETVSLRIAVAGHEADDTVSRERTRADTAEAEIGSLRTQVNEVSAERVRLLAEIARLEDSDRDLQERAAADSRRVAENQALASHQTEVLRQALRTSVLPTVVDHIEAVVAGETANTPTTTRSITSVYVALADFDAWCERADADVVRQHLDRFCAAVVASAQRHNGRLEQVVGHAHFLSFAPDPEGARAGVRCALEIADAVDSADITLPGVVSGLHQGTSVAGFFGDADAVSSVQAGLPLVIARAAVDFAPKTSSGSARGVVVSDIVRAALGNDAGLRMTRLDPSWIRGVNAPVQLALVDRDDDNRGPP